MCNLPGLKLEGFDPKEGIQYHEKAMLFLFVSENFIFHKLRKYK